MDGFLERNFVRLLTCTEDLVCTPGFNKIRCRDYSQTLDQYFCRLSSSELKVNAETLRHYELRLKKLKSSYDVTSLDTLCGSRLLTTSWLTNSDRDESYLQDLDTQPLNTKSEDANDSDSSTFKDHNSTEVIRSVEIRTHVTDSRDLILEERRRINRELREQLLSDSKSFKSGHMNNSSGDKKTSASAQLIHEEEIRREQLASEMLGFVRDLKDQSSMMNQQLRSDCVTLDKSIEHAGRNTNELRQIQNQLENELGSRCGCAVWILFIVAIFLFLEMIFFMKVFRKRVTTSYNYHTGKDEL